MTWRTVSASVCGTSHSLVGDACQDAHHCSVEVAPNGDRYLLAFVSDGAGSAKHGGRGAAMACEEAQHALRDAIDFCGAPEELSDHEIKMSVVTVRQRLSREAESEKCEMRDFACTLLGAVVGRRGALFWQIGDGAIVTSNADGLLPVFWPESGEYINETFFVTDDEALRHLQVATYQTPPSELAVFSDGIQRLALIFESQSVYQPFFDPMFSKLRRTSLEECVELSGKLAAFLGTEGVNARTDDDKTLILATRREAV
jgi:hypothetical protein